MANRQITVEHDGKTLYGQVMTIKRTHLGNEDHGIFTAQLELSADSLGVGFGGWGLDAWSESDKRRIGTAFGFEFIKAIIRTVGVSTWEDLKGARVLALFNGPTPWGATIEGIANLEDEDRVFIPKELAELWKARS